MKKNPISHVKTRAVVDATEYTLIPESDIVLPEDTPASTARLLRVLLPAFFRMGAQVSEMYVAFKAQNPSPAQEDADGDNQ